MAEPTNDAVSDERLRLMSKRLRDDADILVLSAAYQRRTFGTCPPGDNIFEDAAAHSREAADALDALNRRSVTSQASEGEWRLVPIEPTGMMLDALGLDINNGSELWSLMLASAPPASPSKRVERLETATVDEIIEQCAARVERFPLVSKNVPAAIRALKGGAA